ncbi:hypothetical protein [Piscirickettsia salmonis]|nr:hypothetical protein [Piscirickettsia salmonis]
MTMLFEDLQASVLRLLEHVAINLPVAQTDGNFEEEVHRAISFLSKLEKQVERVKSAEVLLDILVCLQESHLVGAYDSVLQEKLLAEYILACEEMMGIAAKEVGAAAKETVEWGPSLRDELLVAGVALISDKDSELSTATLESKYSLSDEEIVLESEATAQEADSPAESAEIVSQLGTAGSEEMVLGPGATFQQQAAFLSAIRQRYDGLDQRFTALLQEVAANEERLVVRPLSQRSRVDVQQSDDTGTLNQPHSGELVAEPSTSTSGASNQLSVGVQVVEQSANIPETESSHQSSTSLQAAGPSTSALEAEIFLQSSVSDEDEPTSADASLSLEQQAQSVGRRAEVTGWGFDLCKQQLENFKKHEAACEQRLDSCAESLTTLEIRVQHLQQMLSARRQKLEATSAQTTEPSPSTSGVGASYQPSANDQVAEPSTSTSGAGASYQPSASDQVIQPSPSTPEAGPSHQPSASEQVAEASPSTAGAGASSQPNMNIPGGPSAQQRLNLMVRKIVSDAQDGRFELGIGGSSCSIIVNGGRPIEVPRRIAQILLIIQANQDGANFTPEDKLRRIQAIQAVADGVQHSVLFFFGRTQSSTNQYIKNLDCGN